MAVYERQVRVDAPLDDVWAFHSTIDGLRALTPDWMHLRVESITGPDGDPDPDVLDAGTSIRLSIRPFGVGPRQTWTSSITDRERSDTEATFEDEMIDGPFDTWVHTHRFRAADGGTVVIDHVEYTLPGILHGISGVASPFFEPMFAYRHRRTRRLLEQNGRDDS